jgi:hypothetical protein
MLLSHVADSSANSAIQWELEPEDELNYRQTYRPTFYRYSIGRDADALSAPPFAEYRVRQADQDDLDTFREKGPRTCEAIVIIRAFSDELSYAFAPIADGKFAEALAQARAAPAKWWNAHRAGLDSHQLCLSPAGFRRRKKGVTKPKLSLVKPDTPLPEAAAFAPTPFDWIDPAEIPPREWLYDQHLIRKYVSGTISPGGVGKSALKIAEALSMATGRGLLTGRDGDPLRVWYWNGEDPEEETRRRVAAACKLYGITREQIGGRLFLDSGRETKIVLAKETRGGLVIGHPVRDALVSAIKSNRIDVFIVDPFVSSHQVSENDNSKINDVVNEFREIADATDCAIELVHHSRKTGGAEVTAEDSRGGGALVNAFRSTRVLNQMDDEEARKNLVDPAERRQYFRMDDGKVNLAPYVGTNRWFKFESVLLGNGRPGLAEDNVGVVTTWKRPKPSEGLPSGSVQKAMAALGDGQWRENMQSKDWVGVPIGEALGLDPGHAGERMRINSLIKEWIAAAYLEVFEAVDEARRSRKFVRPRLTDFT